MYVKAHIQLHVNGQTEDYQVGADVTCDDVGNDRAHGVSSYDVGEPDVSAPGCTLATARLVDYEELPDGWSKVAEDALVQAYADSDESAEEDYSDQMWEGDPDGL